MTKTELLILVTEWEIAEGAGKETRDDRQRLLDFNFGPVACHKHEWVIHRLTDGCRLAHMPGSFDCSVLPRRSEEIVIS